MAEKLGNAGALGLCAFGVSTFCMMLMDTKTVVSGGSETGMAVILGLGLLYGGLVQFIVGLLAWRGGDTFGTVSFTSYGVFWMSFCGLKTGMFGQIGDQNSMGVYMLAWTLLTIVLFVATLRLLPLLRVVFGTASLTFILLTIFNFTHSNAVATVASFVGVLLGLEALYGGVAQVVNEAFEEEVLPVGAEYMDMDMDIDMDIEEDE